MHSNYADVTERLAVRSVSRPIVCCLTAEDRFPRTLTNFPQQRRSTQTCRITLRKTVYS